MLHIFPDLFAGVLHSNPDDLPLKITDIVLCVIVIGSGDEYEVKANFFADVVIFGLQKLAFQSSDIFDLFVFFFEVGIRYDAFDEFVG